MSEKIIKSLSFEELPLCLETIHNAFLPNCEKYGFTKENYPSCAAFVTLEDLIETKKNGTHFYGVFVDGKMAGCVQLKRVEPTVYSFTRFAVLPEYQHLGLGRLLLSHCIKKSNEYGADKMRLLMVYDNAKLRAFYEAFGFKLVKKARDSEHPFLFAIYELDVTEEIKNENMD